MRPKAGKLPACVLFPPAGEARRRCRGPLDVALRAPGAGLAELFNDGLICRCSLAALEEDGFTRGVLRKTLRRLEAAGVLLRERGAPTLIGSTCSWGGHEDRPPLIPSEGHSASASEVARAVCRILTLVISTPIGLPEAPNSTQTPGATSWCRARMASAGPN